MSVNYKVTARTTREELGRFGKDVVAEIAATNGIVSNARQFTKHDLIESIMFAVVQIQAAEQERARVTEEARVELLARERAAGAVHEMLVNLLVAVYGRIAPAQEVVAKFQADVAKGPSEAAYAICWQGEGFLYAMEVIRLFDRCRSFLASQADDQTLTAEQVRAALAESMEYNLCRCLDDGFLLIGSSVMNNANGIAQLKASQEMFKFLRASLAGWNRVRYGEDEPQCLAHIRGW